jgi:ribosomal protein S19
LARSSYKGYWYCRRTVKQVFLNIIQRIKKPSFYLKRNTNIPNYLLPFTIRVESGLFNKKKILSNFMLGLKGGQFSFTRKPYFYPFKKIKNKKTNKL